MKLRIENGQFFRGAELIKPEFGNKEQIDCLKETQRKIDELSEGLIVSTDIEAVYTAKAHFKCPCTKNVYFENEAGDEDDYDSLNGIKSTCHGCKTTYELSTNEDDEIVATIVK